MFASLELQARNKKIFSAGNTKNEWFKYLLSEISTEISFTKHLKKINP